MDTISRRSVLGTAAASLLTAAGVGAVEDTSDGPTSQPQAPEPHRDPNEGGRILGPTNPPLQTQNPDLISPPKTDRGTVQNLHFPFSFAHVKVEPGGWSREVTVRELPVSKSMAGVNMRLKKGAFRELHWHSSAEWSYMIKGKARITAMNTDGSLFVEDVEEGDLWFFPQGIPHSIQGLDSDLPEGGCEFLLVFDEGTFSEDSTFLLTDWLSHTPPEIVARTLNIPVAEVEKIPKKELFIYPCEMPDSLSKEKHNHDAKESKVDYSYRLLKQKPIETKGGTVRIADTKVFPASKGLIAALVEIQPGGFRELHWHTIGDEWQYYLSGFGRMTVFASGATARTFNYNAGDVGFVPASMPHYVENLGNEPLRYLEVFKAEVYDDLSLRQWLAVTPPNLVAGHLMMPKEVFNNLPIKKSSVLPD